MQQRQNNLKTGKERGVNICVITLLTIQSTQQTHLKGGRALSLRTEEVLVLNALQILFS